MRTSQILGSAILIALALNAAGCSQLGISGWGQSGSPRLDVQQASTVELTGVTARETKDGIEVSGGVTARLAAQRPQAPIHAEVMDRTGQVIAHADGKIVGQSPSARQSYRSDFRIDLPINPPPDSTVCVWYGGCADHACTVRTLASARR
jgi:hypothetical protein